MPKPIAKARAKAKALWFEGRHVKDAIEYYGEPAKTIGPVSFGGGPFVKFYYFKDPTVDPEFEASVVLFRVDEDGIILELLTFEY